MDPEVLIWGGFMKKVSHWENFQKGLGHHWAERSGKTILGKSEEEMVLCKENARQL